MPDFDYCQRIYTMADLANDAMNHLNTQENLDELLFHKLSYYLHVDQTAKVKDKYKPYEKPNPAATAALGDGEIVWGPCLFVADDLAIGAATNAAFVVHFESFPCADAKMPDGPVYIVAIAATNPTSWGDIFKQDGDVNQVVNWESFKPIDGKIEADPVSDPETTPYISRGTAQGVADVYCKLRPELWLGQPRLTLAEFIASIDPEDGAAVIFCGHSLAGALSPTLALYMLTRDDKRPLEKFGGRVMTFPTAGATPGNGRFAELYAQSFPTRRLDLPGAPRYAVMNARLWNRYDVVPHAWALSARCDWDGNPSPKMQDILYLYGVPNLLTAEPVFHTVLPAARLSQDSGVRYATLPGVRLDIGRPDTPTDYGAFWKTLLKSHIHDYSHGLILKDGLPGGAPPKP